MDEELRTIISEGIDCGSRIATALETLVNEPLVEIKTPFPQCPHCGVVNPEVQMSKMAETQGKISEFVVEARCINCNESVYGVVLEWSLQPDSQTALQVGHQVIERMKNA